MSGSLYGWHKVFQAFIPRLDVLAGRPFDQDDTYRAILKKYRSLSFRAYAGRSVQAVAAFRPAVGVLHLILILVGHHRIFYRQLRCRLVGNQRIIAGPTDGLVIGALIKPQIDPEPVCFKRYFRQGAGGRRSAALFVFIGHQRFVAQGQTVVKIIMRCDTRQKDIEHRGLPGKLAYPVQLHRLEQDTGDHGDTGLPMGEDFASGIGWHMRIDDIHNAGFFKIVRQNGSKSDRFGIDLVDDRFGHRCGFRKIWKSNIISTRKNIGIF